MPKFVPLSFLALSLPNSQLIIGRGLSGPFLFFSRRCDLSIFTVSLHFPSPFSPQEDRELLWLCFLFFFLDIIKYQIVSH